MISTNKELTKKAIKLINEVNLSTSSTTASIIAFDENFTQISIKSILYNKENNYSLMYKNLMKNNNSYIPSHNKITPEDISKIKYYYLKNKITEENKRYIFRTKHITSFYKKRDSLLEALE